MVFKLEFRVQENVKIGKKICRQLYVCCTCVGWFVAAGQFFLLSKAAWLLVLVIIYYVSKLFLFWGLDSFFEWFRILITYLWKGVVGNSFQLWIEHQNNNCKFCDHFSPNIDHKNRCIGENQRGHTYSSFCLK